MKRILILFVIMAMLLAYSVQADAALYNRGTDILGNSLIYDSDLNITWYDFTNSSASWLDQVNWASGLDIDFAGTHLTGWRLPTTAQPDPACELQFDPGGGFPLQGWRYNCTGSEMGHLYYTESGNTAGGPADDTGVFQNLQLRHYWSGTEYALFTNNAWAFSLNDGIQVTNGKTTTFYTALAVRPGDVVVVPEPVSSLLFVTGGTILGFRSLRKIEKSKEKQTMDKKNT